MYDFGYLKTPPGLLTILATILNIIAFICVITTEEKTSIHAGFLLAVTILGILASITIVVCHVVLSIARKIPPYPFALAQVIGGITLMFMNWSASAALLSKYPNSATLVATAIFSILSGFLHLAQSLWLCKAIKVTQIAREAVNFGNNGGVKSEGQQNQEESVSYIKEKEDVILDPTQTVY